MLKTRFAFSVLLVAWVVGCSDEAPARRPIISETQPIFWQIDAPPVEGETSAARLYLLGSIHVGPKGGWQLPPSILARFEASEALIVEVDMTNGDAPASQDNLVLAHGLLPPGESIKNHISEATYASLAQYADEHGRNLANLNPWQAWMIATMLLTFELKSLGYPTEAGVDLDMMARVAPGQTVIGLETMEEQLSMLSSMSPANQELMLRDMLLQAGDIDIYFNELKEAWRTGDEETLEAVLFRELEQTPALKPFYERAIYDRNKTMCEGFRKQLDQGGTRFGVVGVYHIVGARGIPACLQKLGYKTQRLRDSVTSH